MELTPYIKNLQRQLVVAAETGGEEARALGERLIAPLDAAIRVTLLDALTLAAEEITCDLAPGSVEVRLRGRDPEFVVAAPPPDQHADELYDNAPNVRAPDGLAESASVDGDDGGMSRINLRMPEHLKLRIEHAAASEGLSVNAWLVRAAAAAVERARRTADPNGGQHWALNATPAGRGNRRRGRYPDPDRPARTRQPLPEEPPCLHSIPPSRSC